MGRLGEPTDARVRADRLDEMLAVLDTVVESPDAILNSNTSSIPIMKPGVATCQRQSAQSA